MKKNLKVIIGIVAALIIVGGGYGFWYQKHNATTSSSLVSEQTKTINYDGVEGQSAYELLKSKYPVEASESSFGVMVLSINGLKATSTEFWLYSVNGQQLDVSADKYITHSGDKVTWEYKGM